MDRTGGIGGTDAGAIAGLSPYATRYDVYCEKLGLVPPKPDNPAMEWGRLLEEPVAVKYARAHRVEVVTPPEFVRPDRPWMRGHADRIVFRRDADGWVVPLHGLEIKTSNSPDKWGESGTDHIPAHYRAQCAWYMALFDCDRWDLALLLNGRDYREYRLERDAAFEELLVTQAEHFWFYNVQKKIPPPVDGSGSASYVLNASFPAANQVMLQGDPDTERLARQLAIGRAQLEELKAANSAMENKLKFRVADAKGMRGRGWSVMWTNAAGRTRTDWEAVARAYAGDSGWSDIVAKNTARGANYRRFVVNV